MLNSLKETQVTAIRNLLTTIICEQKLLMLITFCIFFKNE